MHEDEHGHDEWNTHIFSKSTGMPNHSSEAVKQDLALVKKEITKQGKGQTCLPDDYATIHWTARVQATNTLVEDSRRYFGVNHPKVFLIGHYDRIRCFDLIVAQMKPGESAKIFCPS